MKAKRNFISKLFEIGTKGIDDEEHFNRIKNVNIISLAVFFSLLIIGPILFHCFNYKLSLVIPLTVEFFLNLSVVAFNYYKKHLTAAIILYYLQVAAVPYFSFILDPLLQLEAVVALQILVAFLIFKGKKLRRIALAGALIDLIIIEVIYCTSTTVLKMPLYDAFIIRSVVMVTVICIIILVSTKQGIGNDLRYELKKANGFIRTFMARVTHDLKAPFDQHSQLTEIMKREIKRGAPVQKLEKLLDLSTEVIHTGRSLLTNVTEVNVIESGMLEVIKNDTFLLVDFFTRVIEVNNTIAQRANVRIKLKIEDMPSIIECDQLNLNLIVTNLLINAIKHGYKDRDVQVLIQRYRKDRWTIKVTNEGPGIPRDKLETIFLPYTTSASGQAKGNGLGLYIVKTKAWAMGGMVDVESVQDGHTTFAVTFPLVEGKVMNLPLKASGAALKEELGNLHIILVEDNHLNAKGMVYLLEEFGCSVTVLRSGAELLKKLEDVLPDIIMLDYYLPGMCGNVVIEKIRSIPATRHIPVIAATGGIHGGEIQEMLSAGADTFFKKDVDIDGLRLALQQCTKKKQINYSKE